MTVVIRRPGPPLDGLVRSITYQAGHQPRTSVEKLLPDASVSMWINLNRDEFRSFGPAGMTSVPGAMLAGPRTRALVHEFEQGRAHLSVAFTFGAAASFRLPPDVAAGELAPLNVFWGRDSADLRERLLAAATPRDMLGMLEDALRRRLAGPLAPDPAMAEAARSLAAGLPVAKVAADLGLLPRTLRRRFTAQAGLTPKRFARVQRFRRVVRSLDGVTEADWAAVAAAHGYCDQPHLAGEFRAIADVTPAEYLNARIDGPNHLRYPEAAASSVRKCS